VYQLRHAGTGLRDRNFLAMIPSFSSSEKLTAFLELQR
jgi:hypothetical protein